eukprot:COSAG01_NODE_1696_length_9461_cov_8.289010_11_plen_31_part_00
MGAGPSHAVADISVPLCVGARATWGLNGAP